MRCDRGMIVCGDHTASRCSADSQGLPSTRPDSPGRSHIVTQVSMSRRLQRMPPAAIIGTFGIIAPSAPDTTFLDRTRLVLGKRVSVRVAHGGVRFLQQKTNR